MLSMFLGFPVLAHLSKISLLRSKKAKIGKAVREAHLKLMKQIRNANIKKTDLASQVRTNAISLHSQFQLVVAAAHPVRDLQISQPQVHQVAYSHLK